MGLFNRLKDRLRIGRLRHCSHFMIDPVRQLRVVTTLCSTSSWNPTVFGNPSPLNRPLAAY